MSKLKDRVENALRQDNSLVCDISVVNETKPFTEEYFKALGLSKNDLKKLERHGLAARRYTKNVWVEGETLPNGKTVEKGKRYNGKGRRVAWILIAPQSHDQAQMPELRKEPT